MGINIGNYGFDGPHLATDHLRAQSGVYAILGRNSEFETWSVVDIGESGFVRDRVASHDRFEDWKRREHGVLSVAAYYCDEVSRMRIERELRAQFYPPCGDR